MKKIITIFLGLLIFTLSGCEERNELLIATTTSLDNSGLLEYIIPYFEEEYDCNVKVVALGTGAALEIGEMGEVDILLVHDYARELEFINNGFGEKRHDIMYNDFIFVGPELLNTTSITDTLEAISSSKQFYSRGDMSGTHSRELSLWETYGYDVSSFDDWYKETGQSMGSTLSMTSLSSYYTFTDRSTFIAMQDDLDLVIAYENPIELTNQYGIIKVSNDLHNRNDELANQFYDWMLSEDTQSLIATYIINDEQLFYPNAGD